MTKNRYADWPELMDYCRLSAAPVGRFVLDVHGEDPATWRAPTRSARRCRSSTTFRIAPTTIAGSIASTCRCDTLAAHGASVEMLGAPKRSAGPARGASPTLAARTSELVSLGRRLAGKIRDVRLGCEIAAIQALARRLARDLESRDPLSERVHFGKAGFALSAASALRVSWLRR